MRSLPSYSSSCLVSKNNRLEHVIRTRSSVEAESRPPERLRKTKRYVFVRRTHLSIGGSSVGGWKREEQRNKKNIQTGARTLGQETQSPDPRHVSILIPLYGLSHRAALATPAHTALVSTNKKG